MSLTQTAYMSRQLIKFGGSGLVVFVILWSIISAGYKAYIKAHPAYIAPTVRYGMLPKIVFPDRQTEAKTFSFQLPNDAIPKFKDQANIYVVYQPNSSFLALENDTKTAADFGFDSQPTEIKPGIYEFKNDTLNKILTVNVLDGNFKITYPYTSDQLLLNPVKMPTKNEAIIIASDFLNKGKKLTTDLENGEKKVSYWQIQGNGLKAVESQAEANAARVDFYRENFNGLSLMSINYGQASVSVLVSGSDVESKRIIDVSFKDVTIDRESFSTYPIKTTQQAIDDLNNGNYWTAVDVTDKNVIIRKIYLAYFEPATLTNYLQPIFVFEGDNNFVAYVPAVDEKYIK
jgi:hypothetical protein